VLMTFDELCAFLKAEEALVLALIEAGSVPPPVNIGDQLVRWVESDLARWVQMGCPKFPPPTPEEIRLLCSKRLAEIEISGCADEFDVSGAIARMSDPGDSTDR
jgi:predicted DNA-binding transcriptional regulator AlpA